MARVVQSWPRASAWPGHRWCTVARAFWRSASLAMPRFTGYVSKYLSTLARSVRTSKHGGPGDAWGRLEQHLGLANSDAFLDAFDGL